MAYVDIAPIIGIAAPGVMDTPGRGTVSGRVNVMLMALLAPFPTPPTTLESWVGRHGGCAYACREERGAGRGARG